MVITMLSETPKSEIWLIVNELKIPVVFVPGINSHLQEFVGAYYYPSLSNLCSGLVELPLKLRHGQVSTHLKE